MTTSRSCRFEVWTCTESGSPQLHGTAFGVTFEDACKQLATESIDFWTHFSKGCYRDRPLWPSRSQALAASESE